MIVKATLLCYISSLASTVYGSLLHTESYSGYFHHPVLGEVGGSWEYIDGTVIYNGDTVYGPVEDFKQRIINTTWSSTLGPHVYIAPPANYTRETAKRSFSLRRTGEIWPKGVIKYKYIDNAAEAKFAPRVNAAMAAWRAVVPCIRFSKLPNSGVLSRDILTIRPGYGCHSTVGHLSFHNQQMYLENGCAHPQMLHEFGHVLGLEHENQRPDSSRYVKFICENVLGFPFGTTVAQAKKQCCSLNGPGCGTTSQFLLKPASSFLYDQDGPHGPGAAYDLQSVMHYRASAFAKPGTLTLVGAPSTENTRISAGDAARVRALYCH